MLNQHFVVELEGAPGVGKSVLAKELIGTNGNMVLELELSNCRSTTDVCRQIDARLHGDLLEGAGQETYIRQLRSEPYTFWIRSYDEVSAGSVNEFLRTLQSTDSEPSYNQSCWIVESRTPLKSCVANRFEVRALDNLSVSRILSGIHKGGAFDDVEDVVDRAQGNPRRAIMLWGSRNTDDLEDLDEVSWFVRQLTLEEKRILPILCQASSLAPLGITLKSLVHVAAYSGLLKSQIDFAFNSLLKKLETYQLADVTRFEADSFDDLLHDVLPDQFGLVVVNHVNAKLIEHTSQMLSETERDRLLKDLSDVLLKAEHTDTLGFITFAIREGDLEPFFRSSFRYTSLGQLLHWIDQTRWIPPNSRQEYLLKALRVLTSMKRDQPLNSRALLDQPDISDHVQGFAYTFVTVRAVTVQPFKPTINLQGVLNAISEQYRDPDLQAAAFMSISNALQNADRPKDAWRVLRDLPKRFADETTAKGLSIHRALEFLNGSKSRRKVMEDQDAYPLMQDLAKGLILEGLRVENVSLICDGLFHYVRAQEMKAARVSCREVLSYRAALKFVEDAPRTRVRQRLKILLTQGSVHRHFCRDGNLTWVEFAPHFDEGIERYLRAFRSAQAHNHTLHLLNAASYMINLCLTALRFREELGAGEILLARVTQIVPLVSWLQDHLVVGELWEGEKLIFSNVRRNFPLLLYLSLIGNSDTDVSKVENLCDSFTRATHSLADEAGKTGNQEDRIQAVKNIEFTLRALNRALDFGQQRDIAVSRALLESLRPQLTNVVSNLDGISRNGRIEKERRKLANRL